MMRGMRSSGLLSTACLLVLTGASGCATMQSVESLQRQVVQLQGQNFQLRKDLAEAKVRAQMQAERRNAPGPAVGDAEVEVEIPLPAGRELPGSPQTIYSEPITDASRYTSGPLASKPPARGVPASPAASRSAGTPVELMDGARRALDSKEPATAMEMFQRVVTVYPGDGLADDAQFGLGECLFQMERYEDAIAACARVGEVFPYGDQVPSAQLKTGFALLALHRRPEALSTFRKVSETWPGTEAATVARQQMAHLKASDR